MSDSDEDSAVDEVEETEIRGIHKETAPGGKLDKDRKSESIDDDVLEVIQEEKCDKRKVLKKSVINKVEGKVMVRTMMMEIVVKMIARPVLILTIARMAKSDLTSRKQEGTLRLES